MSTDDRFLHVLRAQAWERAKGELMSVLHTFYDSHRPDSNFEKLNDLTVKFIETVEDNGLAE